MPARAKRLSGIPGFGIDRVAAAAGTDPEVLRLENLDTDLPPPPGVVSATRAGAIPVDTQPRGLGGASKATLRRLGPSLGRTATLTNGGRNRIRDRIRSLQLERGCILVLWHGIAQNSGSRRDTNGILVAPVSVA